MNRRLQVLGLGLALLALLGVGAISGRGVFAQDATPTPSTTNPSTTTPERDPFLDAFAAQLGVTDQAKIDAAIQAAAAQVLDQKVAAGELTQQQADAIKARVAAGDLRIVVGGREGVRVFRGGHDRGDHDKRGNNGNEDNGQSDNDTDDQTPANPSATPAAGSSASV